MSGRADVCGAVRMSRRLVSLLIAFVLAAGLLIGCADASTTGADGRLEGWHKPGSSAESTAASQTPAVPEPEPEPAPTVPKTTQGTVTRVVDGDTAVITLSGGASEKVRFIGINTPESTTRHEPYGEEASAYTKRVLTGRTVYLETDVELRDKYGRLLAYIWLEKPVAETDAEIRTKMFNARLLLDGFAEQATYPPNVKYVDFFAVYAREAREAERGLWSPSVGSGTSSSGGGTGAAIGGSSGSSAGSGSSGGGTSGAAYIGNSNTLKFHYPTCSSVDQMNPEHKVPLASRAAAIAGGYVPCGRCDP